MKAKLIIAAVTSLALASSTQAAEIKLLASSAIKETYLELLPLFEKATLTRYGGVVNPARHSEAHCRWRSRGPCHFGRQRN